ncbi:MAG: hypothetical protein H7249_19255 [Chitinophagaceae bacterium]|nr:hypothetical protein [Oligoflexus sp.]
MKTRFTFISRILFQGSLLIALVACSDSTQFAEKTSAAEAAIKAATETPPPDTVNPTTYDSTAPTGVTVANKTDTTGAAAKPSGAAVAATGTSGTGVGSTSGSGTGSTAGAGSGTAGGSTSGGSGSTGTNGAASPNAPLFSDCVNHANLAVEAQLYKLPSTTDHLPDFSTMTPEGNVCVNQLNIADRDFTQGFPGVSDIFEWFALDMKFKVNITTAGTYQFFLNSDDGSILSIDNSTVITNDGNHAQIEKTGSRYLGVGIHDFHVRYYQGPRYRIALELFWQTPGSNAKVYIPAAVMSRP